MKTLTDTEYEILLQDFIEFVSDAAYEDEKRQPVGPFGCMFENAVYEWLMETTGSPSDVSRFSMARSNDIPILRQLPQDGIGMWNKAKNHVDFLGYNMRMRRDNHVLTYTDLMEFLYPFEVEDDEVTE